MNGRRDTTIVSVPREPVKANSHMPCLSHAVPLPCRAPVIFRQCRALRESLCGRRKYATCWSYSLTDWCASDNKLCGTPRGNRKKPNAGRSPTCRLWTTDANSHMPCHAHVTLCRGLEKSLSERRRGMARARHGMCEPNTAALCKSNGKDTIYTLIDTAWQGNGMGAAWERHGMCKLALKETTLNRSICFCTPHSRQSPTDFRHSGTNKLMLQASISACSIIGLDRAT
jgi:hypothetical protein